MIRFTLTITIGSRHPAAKWSISCINANPWEEVAVNVRTPVSEAPMQDAMAECSDSVRIMMPFKCPEASQLESLS
jgi:hypothetical protein